MKKTDTDIAGLVDLEILDAQIAEVEEKLPPDGTAAFLLWVKLAVKEHGIVLILNADAKEPPPFDKIVAGLKELATALDPGD